MRKFIISDIHGNGEVYDSIIGYLENIALEEDVELYINGDLIDRGFDSFRILEDVLMRIKGMGNIKIHYLAGNHELMMYQALLNKKANRSFTQRSDWILNGGWVIADELDYLDDDRQKCEEYKDFLGNLDIYHKFSEVIDGNQLLLVHAQAPKEVYTPCHMKISDNDRKVYKAVWTRKRMYNLFSFVGELAGYKQLGKEGYLTIIGHTPVKNDFGFSYDKRENCINIDGGCAGYATGHFEYNRVPLVEVDDEKLTILIFNHNNEIIDGYYMDSVFYKMNHDELDEKRAFLDQTFDHNEEENKKFIKNILIV